MPIVSTTTPQKNTVKAMQLKALEQRQKDAALALGKATQYQTVESPWQGAGNMLNSFFTARRGSQLQAQEDAARDEVAKIRAGFGPEGPNMAQIQQLAKYDEDTANKLQSELQQRNFTRSEREAGQVFTASQQEDTQAHQTSERIGGQVFTKDERESTQQFEERKAAARAKVEADAAATAAVNDQITAQKKVETDQSAAATAAVNDQITAQNAVEANKDTAAAAAVNDQLKQDDQQQAAADAAKLLADAKLAEPDSPEGQIYRDFIGNKYGDPNTPEAKQRFKEAWDKATVLPQEKTSTTKIIGANGETVEITDSTGGGGRGGGGGGKGAPQQLSLEEVLANAKSGADLKAQNAQIRESLQNPGYTGWLGDTAGTAAQSIGDASASAIDRLFGTNTQDWMRQNFTGDPGSRAVLSAAGTQKILDNVRSLPGAISNKESDRLAKLGPGLGNRPDANELMVNLADRMVENLQKKAEMAKAYYMAPQPGAADLPRGTLDGFDAIWDAYLEAHPSMDYDEASGKLTVLPLNAAAPAPTTATPPPASGNPALDDALNKYR